MDNIMQFCEWIATNSVVFVQNRVRGELFVPLHQKPNSCREHIFIYLK